MNDRLQLLIVADDRFFVSETRSTSTLNIKTVTDEQTEWWKWIYSASSSELVT